MCNECGHEEYLDKIEDLLAVEDNKFLKNVHTWVEDKQHITDNQKEAIDKMY